MFHRSSKLHDCQRHGIGSDSELFVVEGDSASKSVCRARNPETQAVLPMQGKPMNAIKATRGAVEHNDLFRVLVDAIGVGWDQDIDLDNLRYERVILLFDPDADGIHCGALMLMFFHRWMRPLLDTGRLSVVRAPLYEIASPDRSEIIHAYSEEHYRRIRDELERKKIAFQGQLYRGLASLSLSTLLTTCLNQDTRNIHPLNVEDAKAAIGVFVG